LGNRLNRQLLIDRLAGHAPVVLSVTSTYDMGFEIKAIVSQGVVYPYPGMLLDLTDGYWPAKDWVELPDDELEREINAFLEGGFLDITPWEDMDDHELIELLDDLGD
jgi:hypothetical protein